MVVITVMEDLKARKSIANMVGIVVLCSKLPCVMQGITDMVDFLAINFN